METPCSWTEVCPADGSLGDSQEALSIGGLAPFLCDLSALNLPAGQPTAFDYKRRPDRYFS